jgi:hypothetical protein
MARAVWGGGTSFGYEEVTLAAVDKTVRSSPAIGEGFRGMSWTLSR